MLASRLLTAILALSLFVLPVGGQGSIAVPAPTSHLMTADGVEYSLERTDEFPYCVVYLAPVQPGQTVSESDVACFQTADAVANVTQDDLNITSPARPDSACYPNGTIGYSYDYANYGGLLVDWRSYECWEPICSDGSRFLYGQVPGYANDRISSARTYGGCQSRHWTEQNFGGAVEACNPNCPTMYLSNLTSSISFIPYYE